MEDSAGALAHLYSAFSRVDGAIAHESLIFGSLLIWFVSERPILALLVMMVKWWCFALIFKVVALPGW